MKRNLWPAPKMSPKHREQWARLREKGKRHFILVRGVCMFGGAMFVGLNLIPALWHLWQTHAVDRYVWTKLLAGIVTWPLAGLAFGYFTWAYSERQFAASEPATTTAERE